MNLAGVNQFLSVVLGTLPLKSSEVPYLLLNIFFAELQFELGGKYARTIACLLTDRRTDFFAELMAFSAADLASSSLPPLA